MVKHWAQNTFDAIKSKYKISDIKGIKKQWLSCIDKFENAIKSSSNSSIDSSSNAAYIDFINDRSNSSSSNSNSSSSSSSSSMSISSVEKSLLFSTKIHDSTTSNSNSKSNSNSNSKNNKKPGKTKKSKEMI